MEFVKHLGKLEFSHRQNVSFRTSPKTGVGISIEFRAAYRHTGCSFCTIFRNLPVYYFVSVGADEGIGPYIGVADHL